LREAIVPQSLTLSLAIVALVGWIILAFVVQVPSGLVHLLLAAGVTLLVRWIALRDAPRTT
jgi:hypothetical protein